VVFKRVDGVEDMVVKVFLPQVVPDMFHRVQFGGIGGSNSKRIVAVGMPVAQHPPQSGRIEARFGLRMMPTFPRSPLSFRTAGFPQYGWKAGVSSGAFPVRQPSLKPAPGIHRKSLGLHPLFVHSVVPTIVPF